MRPPALTTTMNRTMVSAEPSELRPRRAYHMNIAVTPRGALWHMGEMSCSPTKRAVVLGAVKVWPGKGGACR
jgi:hypothetical protein